MSKQQILLIALMMCVILIVPFFVFAQPPGNPPVSNVNANFSSVTINDGANDNLNLSSAGVISSPSGSVNLVDDLNVTGKISDSGGPLMLDDDVSLTGILYNEVGDLVVEDDLALTGSIDVGGAYYKDSMLLFHTYENAAAWGRNTFFGLEAGNLSLLANGSNNTGLGYQALNSLVDGYHNTAVGNQALKANTSGYMNTAIGANSLDSNTSGLNNTAVGNDALGKNTSGTNNTALGRDSIENNTTGSYNTAVGGATLQNSNGGNNTAIGYTALKDTTAGNNNTGIGYGALVSALSSDNTAVGVSALSTGTTGGQNTALGMGAGFLNNTGSGNIFVGYQAGYNETGSNNLYIDNSSTVDPLIYGDFANNEVGINTGNPSAQLDVNGTVKIEDSSLSGYTSSLELSVKQNMEKYFDGHYGDTSISIPDTVTDRNNCWNAYGWVSGTGGSTRCYSVIGIAAGVTGFGIDANDLYFLIHSDGRLEGAESNPVTISDDDGLEISNEAGTIGATISGDGSIAAKTITTNGPVYGVSGSGATAGGYFEDTNSTGYAYLGYGMRPIDAFGSNGGKFTNTNTGSNAEVGALQSGVIAYGNTQGGYFADLTESGYARIGTGDYGVTGYGNTMGGYFQDRDNTATYANIAYGGYGVQGVGTTMGGNFTSDNSGFAYAAYNDAGINAQGNAYGGYFKDIDDGYFGYVGYGGWSFYGNGSAAKSGGGSWSTYSDERLKDVKGDYERG